jgi:ribosomal protein S18 acetylase RimI-like enzyme
MIAFRPVEDKDADAVIELWTACGLTRPWNDARRDFAFARGRQGSDILVGLEDGAIASCVMVGHDGHRGWLYYLSVSPLHRGRGIGKATVRAAEVWLKARGIWAVNLNIRSENVEVRDFYASLGYELRDVIVMGKRGVDG